MIAIIDYKAGNICSVENALQRLGAPFICTSQEEEIRKASKVILPGVGNAAFALERLKESGLAPVIRQLRQPVLGICVGMQLLCRSSEEGPTEGLGIFDSRVCRFPDLPDVKVPHMGWNTIGNLESKLFAQLPPERYAYFVHSYYAQLCPDTIATASYAGILFSAALKYENFYGTQFHPEKSGSLGAAILRNFVSL